MIKVEAFGKVWEVPDNTKWLTLDKYGSHTVHVCTTEERPTFLYDKSTNEHFAPSACHKAIGVLTEGEHAAWHSTL